MTAQDHGNPNVRAFWEAYVSAAGATGTCDVWSFGGDDTPALATELANLVLTGRKTATTSLLRDYTADAEPLPRPGTLSLILDGRGEPACVIRTRRVQVRPFGEVDAAFAWSEGEGDRSLAQWRDSHLRFFADAGSSVDDETPVVLEWFDLVWPPP